MVYSHIDEVYRVGVYEGIYRSAAPLGQSVGPRRRSPRTRPEHVRDRVQSVIGPEPAGRAHRLLSGWLAVAPTGLPACRACPAVVPAVRLARGRAGWPARLSRLLSGWPAGFRACPLLKDPVSAATSLSGIMQ